MSDVLAMALGWGIVAISFFTFLSIQAWTNARRREREAYYKAEAVKKMAEMQGTTPEPVLQVLRETMAAWKEQPSVANMGPIQAKAYFKAETVKRIAEMQGAGADSVLALLREEERLGARRTRLGLKLGGLISCAAGLALVASLWVVVPDKPVYVVGSIPMLVGLVLLGFSYLPSPKGWEGDGV